MQFGRLFFYTGHPPSGGVLFYTTYIECDMKTLDLHGIEHLDVEIRVINFILMNETPLKIITGDSYMMRQIVFTILHEHEFEYYPEFHTNYGAFIVHDKRK